VGGGPFLKKGWGLRKKGGEAPRVRGGWGSEKVKTVLSIENRGGLRKIFCTDIGQLRWGFKGGGRGGSPAKQKRVKKGLCPCKPAGGG